MNERANARERMSEWERSRESSEYKEIEINEEEWKRRVNTNNKEKHERMNENGYEWMNEMEWMTEGMDEDKWTRMNEWKTMNEWKKWVSTWMTTGEVRMNQ